MAYTRLFWNNLIDLAATVITPSSEGADLPAVNVVNSLRTKKWRTGTSTAAESIAFDLGAAMAVQGVVILDHNLTAGDTNIRLQGGATPGATTVNQAITWNAGAMFAVLSSAQTYRYWQIVFTKSASGETRDIGRIFIGPVLEFTASPDIHDISIEWQDESKRDRAAGGAAYSDIKAKYRRIQFPLPFIYGDDASVLDAAAEAMGEGIPFFCQVDPDRKPNAWLFYCVFRSIPKLNTIAWDPETMDYVYKSELDLSEEV